MLAALFDAGPNPPPPDPPPSTTVAMFLDCVRADLWFSNIGTLANLKPARCFVHQASRQAVAVAFPSFRTIWPPYASWYKTYHSQEHQYCAGINSRSRRPIGCNGSSQTYSGVYQALPQDYK
ncbi:hypothetical protein BGX28_010342 [Mortierella sp. GBA30]|nr:hypothetical protein BGX28_010342 [Mortierella sp. GBA30]